MGSEENSFFLRGVETGDDVFQVELMAAVVRRLEGLYSHFGAILFKLFDEIVSGILMCLRVGNARTEVHLLLDKGVR